MDIDRRARLAVWSVDWTTRHISELTELCPDARLPCSVPRTGTNLGSNRLGATTYHDLQLGWKTEWLGGLQLSAGATNLFAKAPPICLTCSLNGYDASTYDLMGRFVYVRASIKF